MIRTAARPRTWVLPPAPFAAAIVGGWWLDRHRWPLPLSQSDALRGFGWLLVAVALLLFAWIQPPRRAHDGRHAKLERGDPAVIDAAAHVETRGATGVRPPPRTARTALAPPIPKF